MSLRLLAPRPSALSPSISLLASTSRGYSTPAPAAPSRAEQKRKMDELQAKQVKLAEKAGRMKQNSQVTALIPVFANSIRPKGGRNLAPGTDLATRWGYIKHDVKNWAYSLYLRYGFRRALGDPKWVEHFENRAVEAYKAVNTALASGNYAPLTTLATPALIDDVKSQRARRLNGLRLNWKLHSISGKNGKPEIVCVRQQEIAKKDEFVAQIAVRFETTQSLEVRDTKGNLVKGSHDKPERVTEYYAFQRDMWRPEDDWRIIKKVQETDPMLDPTTAI